MTCSSLMLCVCGRYGDAVLADTTGDGIGDTMYMVPANQQKVMKMNMATKVTHTNSTSR